MNKLIQLLCVIAGCLTAQVGMASAPAARAVDREIVSSDVLMRGLKYGFKDYYNTYSHSLEIMKDILTCDNKEYNEIVDSLRVSVEDLCARELINRITDDEGNTPLILAAKYNCPIMIKYLIEQCGVTNFDAKNMYGHTAYDYMRTPSDRIGSSELDDRENCFKISIDNPEKFYEALKPVFEGSMKYAGAALDYSYEVKLKHKPVIHGNKKAAEYLKEKRLAYKYEQAKARDPRLKKLLNEDAQRAIARTKRQKNKLLTDNKKIEEIRAKNRAAIATRTENERMQIAGVHSEIPAQQAEEAARIALIQAQKAQEETQKKEQERIKQESNIIYKLKMDRVKAEHTKKLLQEWKWAALESKRKKEVVANIERAKKESEVEQAWLTLDKQRRERIDIKRMFTQNDGHNNPAWYARCYQVYMQQAGNTVALGAGAEDQQLLQWWHENHDQAGCAVCNKYKQAQLAAAGQPKKLQRRNSF